MFDSDLFGFKCGVAKRLKKDFFVFIPAFTFFMTPQTFVDCSLYLTRRLGISPVVLRYSVLLVDYLDYCVHTVYWVVLLGKVYDHYLVNRSLNTCSLISF